VPLDQAEAIVLRTFPLADQDKVAVFLTRDKGIVRGVAKGARKFGNRFGSSLEPMSHIVVFFYEKERRELVTVSSCDLKESFFDIQADIRAGFAASYFAELAEEFVQGRSHEDLAFRLLLSALQALRDRVDAAALTRYFESWILQINGVLPDVHRCKRCRTVLAESAPGWLSPRRDGVYCDGCAPARKEEAGERLGRFVAWTRQNPPAACAAAPFTAEELKSIQKALQAMIVYHLEREPRTLRFVK
jgi:DNA repair protein RecO (recombination protein O)